MNAAGAWPAAAPATNPEPPPLGLAHALALLGADPGLQGMVWRGPADLLEAAADALRQAVQARPAPWVRVPAHLADADWGAHLDLTASLAARRPINQPGVVERARGGVLVLPQASRLSAAALAMLEQGLQRCRDVLVVALVPDGDAEEPPSRLLQRLALVVSLRRAADIPRMAWPQRGEPKQAASAGPCCPAIQLGVAAEPGALGDLCDAATALGITDLSSPWLAWCTARAQAALDGREYVRDEDLALGVRAVLLPRARCLPLPDQGLPESRGDDQERADASPDPPSPPTAAPADAAQPIPRDITDAASPAAPDGAAVEPPPSSGSGWQRLVEPLRPLLAAELGRAADALRACRTAGGGRGAGGSRPATHGRPGSARRGLPRGRDRLDLAATWRAALPWQALRTAPTHPAGLRLQVRRHDLHVRGRTGAPPTTTVFVVDASGSQALHRLAEAKGAVELLLSQCYVRRDRVALIAFSGAGVETLLPPTRALARARSALAALPGGGGTPLAGGLRAARGLSQQVQQRDGQGVRLVLLTDARANLTLDGRPQRDTAWQEALAEARHWRHAGLQGSLIDTAPRPQAAAETLATALGLRYVALPLARAGDVVASLRA